MLEFPASPISGEYYTHGIRSWVWNNTAWVLTGTHVDAATLNGYSGSYYLNAANLTGTYTGVVSGSVTTGQVVGLVECIQDTIGTGFINFGTGISGFYNDTANTYTLSGKFASSTSHGVARFNSTHFSLSAGNVSLNTVPLANIEANTGPYVLGISANGANSYPEALNTQSLYTILSGVPLLTGTPRKFENPIDFSVSNTGTTEGWGLTGFYSLKTMNLLNTATGNVLINLPSAASASGRLHFFKKISSDTNTVSISGSTMIDGDLSPFILYKQWDCVTLFAADSWYVAAYHFE